MPAGGGARGRARVAIPAHTTPHTVQMAALTISAPIVARAGSFAGRKVATKATNGTGKTAMRATWMPGSEPPPTSTAPSPGAYLAPRRRRDATRAQGSIEEFPGRAGRRSRPAIAPSRAARARRDETSAAERSPTVSGGVRLLFSPRPARSRPRAPRARSKTLRLTLPDPSYPSPSLFFPQRLRLRSPRSWQGAHQPRPLPGG